MSNLKPNTKIFGAQWINNYSYPFSPNRTNLRWCDQNAIGFCNTLHGTKRFNHGDGQACDRDIEHQFTPAEIADPFNIVTAHTDGAGDAFIEKVDIFFFSGHGNQDGLFYGVPFSDNGEARFDEMRLGKGGILKWFVADSCRVLDLVGLRIRWGSVFKGLRYMLGFAGDCRDVGDRGWRFANYLNGVAGTVVQPAAGSSAAAMQGETIWRAWEIACLETEALPTLSCACLRAGNTGSVIHFDQWTSDSLPEDSSTRVTFWRNVYVANS